MGDLLSGLDAFGLEGLEGMDLFAKEEEKKVEKKEEKKPQEVDFIFDKSYTCPICDKPFKVKTVRAGKARLIGTDQDLRPRYEQLDVLKYDVMSCPYCGYTVLASFWGTLTSVQRKAIVEKICRAFKGKQEEKEIYTYEDAIERYKLALVNAIVKNAKPAEKAYICLKYAWIYRGAAEALDKNAPDYQEKLTDYKKQEETLLKNAMEGFSSARQTDNFPICNMNETTLDYLLATLAIRFKNYDEASKLISGILASTTAPSRMKDKARDLRDAMAEQKKQG